MKNLTNKVAVITGGAGGIGRALAMECAAAGMDVALADVDEPGMAETASEVAKLGRRALCIPTDVRKAGAVQALLDRTLAELNGCHLMVNNAGVFSAVPLVETTAAQYQRSIDINIGGVVHGSRIFGAHFAQQGQGHLVNTASAAGLFPVPGMSAYSLTKYAVVGYTLQLRWELASRGVGVTVLCPGTVKTDIVLREGVGFKPEEARKLIRDAPGPERLARKTLRAVRRNRPMVRYGPDAYAMSLMQFLPLWLIDPLGKLLARTALKVVETTTLRSGSSDVPKLQQD
ncbi:MAG: SDR family NAD(P)-dependent oxidoreductase [Myxococcales bacterium]|nr:SDR family NAD(P)-dependent oxidoreductase [Myxococcales bacterium]MDD9971963.1 SDR family NAD(P)-dependent oxidoreductase [Myxococcales bacterium]